jgi:predicted regulator of Ras-like GTPase activity (Roadblock/LC7/MglB family)
MMDAKTLEQLRNVLKEVVRTNNLDGLVLADIEGLPIVSYLQEGMDEDTLAAAGAAIFTAGLMTASDAGKQGLTQVVLHSPDGYIIYTQVSEEYVLGLIAPEGAKLGVLKMVIKKIADELKKLNA